jgi:putative endonuclease
VQHFFLNELVWWTVRMNTKTLSTPLVHTPPLDTRSLANLESIRKSLLSPDTDSRSLGNLGEEFVTCWLQARGWNIIDRNWRSRYGELDVVAFDLDGTLVFIEVKTRRSTTYGAPQDAVTPKKQAHLRSTASQWLLAPEHRCRRTGIRFDVVALLLIEGSLTIRHIAKAF